MKELSQVLAVVLQSDVGFQEYLRFVRPVTLLQLASCVQTYVEELQERSEYATATLPRPLTALLDSVIANANYLLVAETFNDVQRSK